MTEKLSDILSSINNIEHRMALEKLLRQLFNVDGHSRYPRAIQFDLADGTPSAEGLLQWNPDDGTLEYGLKGGNVNLQIGQEQLVRVRNSSGADIPDGRAVFVFGADANRPKIAMAKADSINTSGAVGVTTEPIAKNEDGFVCTAGLVRDIDTNDFDEGDLLYLSADDAGQFTATIPNAPNRTTVIGFCLSAHPTKGIIVVRSIIIPGILSASDVYTETPSDGDVLMWSAANGRFELTQLP